MDAKTVYQERPWLKFYPEIVPPTVDVPPHSLPEVFDSVCTKHAGRTAIIFYGNKVSFKRLKEEVDRFATALHDMGIRKGDTVALYLLNSPQFVIAYFGVLKVGAIVTPISPVYTSIEVKYQLEDSGATTIVCQDFLFDRVENTGLNLRHVILSSIEEYLPATKKLTGKTILGSSFRKTEAPSARVLERPGYFQFQKLIRKYEASPPKVEIDPFEDVAVLPYTGGTTAEPKGAILTHHNLLACRQHIKYFWPVFEEGKEVVPAILPFYHIYGQVVVMFFALLQASTLLLFTTPTLDDILSEMEKYKATSFFSVPTSYQYLKDHPRTDRVDWKRVKILTSGADTLHESTVAEWERRTGTSILEGYGLTECSAVSHANPLGRPKAGSFGVPLPNIIAAVVDPDTCEYLQPGGIGEMIIAGPNLMKGYWRKPDETSQALLEKDGRTWLRTGDLVSMDDEGYFFFFDRMKDMIKFMGYSVFAREIEEVLHQHPQVKAAGVVGVPDPRVGHSIKAVVVLQSEARGKISERDIIKFCTDKLANYKVPRVVEFRGELPKTDVGKVSHRELREELE